MGIKSLSVLPTARGPFLLVTTASAYFIIFAFHNCEKTYRDISSIMRFSILAIVGAFVGSALAGPVSADGIASKHPG